MNDNTYSDGHIAPPNFHDLIARSRGCPDGWRWVSGRMIGDGRETGAILIRGAVYPPYKSGKRKGSPNYSKPVDGTESELVIAIKDLDAFIEQWERDTGKCSGCGGCGETLASSGTGGNKYRECSRCKRTGKAP